MSRHVLVITGDDEDFDFDIECFGDCDCYEECMLEHPTTHPWEEHPEDDDSDCPCDPIEDLEAEFHGVLHTYHQEYGWTVPFVGCGVRESCRECDSLGEIAREYGIGRWVVAAEWDEWHACLSYEGPDGVQP